MASWKGRGVINTSFSSTAWITLKAQAVTFHPLEIKMQFVVRFQDPIFFFYSLVTLTNSQD